VKKRHVYFTIVSGLETSDVIWVGRGRKKETLDAFWAGLSEEERAQIEGIAMDIYERYIQSILLFVPGAADKIVFYKFFITMHLTRAGDLTRRPIMREGGHSTSGQTDATSLAVLS